VIYIHLLISGTILLVILLKQNSLPKIINKFNAIIIHLATLFDYSFILVPQYLPLLVQNHINNSFCDVCDGFHFLHDLIFSLSPQLSGGYHDFCIDISKLTFLPDKHISTFYKRVIELSKEILLATISNGALAELGYQFIYLLCSTNCPTIIGILVPYWKAIPKHCWDPNHLSLPLPWTFKEIYDNLISCNINVLPFPSSSDLPPTDPIVARGSSATFTSPGSNRPTSSKHTTIGIHRSKDGCILHPPLLHT
jgi:hypothetical protein